MKNRAMRRYAIFLTLLAALSVLLNPSALFREHLSDWSSFSLFVYDLFHIEPDDAAIKLGAVIQGMIPVIILIFSLSNFIIKDQNVEAEHIITRYKSRREWLFWKIGGLFGLSFFFMLFYIGIHVWMSVCASAYALEISDVVRFVLTGTIYLLFALYHSIVANLFRMLLSEAYVFVCTFAHLLLELAVLAGTNGGVLEIVNFLNPTYYLLGVWRMDEFYLCIGIVFLILLCTLTGYRIERKLLLLDIGTMKGREAL